MMRMINQHCFCFEILLCFCKDDSESPGTAAHARWESIPRTADKNSKQVNSSCLNHFSLGFLKCRRAAIPRTSESMKLSSTDRRAMDVARGMDRSSQSQV